MTDRSGLSVVLSPDDLFGIGPLLGGTPSALSPYRAGEALPLSQEQMTRLQHAGVIDANGAVDSQHFGPLRLLTGASGVTRVRLTGETLFEFSVYVGSDGGPSVSLLQGPSGLLLESPPATVRALAYLEDALGASSRVGSEASFDLSPVEALVFGALLDEHRRGILRGVADDAEPSTPAVDAARIADLLSHTDGYLSVASAVGVAIEWDEPPARDTIERALETLTAAGHVAREGSGYSLADRGASLAGRFLLLERVLSLVVGDESSGEVTWIGLTCLIGGIHDILMIEAGDDHLRLETISASALVHLLELYLTRPERASGRPSAALCASCGEELEPGARFCGVCGSPTA